MIKSSYYLRSVSPSLIPLSCGLPNLGNTCFLNSVIQQLYQMQIIHDFLTSPSAEENQLICNLKILFEMMKSYRNQAEKIIILKKLQYLLTFQLTDFCPGMQYNSLVVFLTFLENIFSLNQSHKFQFQVVYSIRCKCSDLAHNFSQVYIPSQQSTCANCSTSIKNVFKQFPNYLIVTNQKDRQRSLFLKAQEQSQIEYELQSRNIYVGNERSGHYFAESFYNKQAYMFSDRSILKGEEKYLWPSKFSVYRKSIKNLSIKLFLFPKLPLVQNNEIKPDQKQKKYSYVKIQTEVKIQAESEDHFIDSIDSSKTSDENLQRGQKQKGSTHPSCNTQFYSIEEINQTKS